MSHKPPEINPEDLEPTIDIPLKTQREILLLHAVLESADHYVLLGVSSKSDKKEIKNAYFALMNRFHTDKFYGKNIGAFGPRLQQIIQKLTKANDTLTRNNSRAEYDGYLKSRAGTVGARNSTPPEPRITPSPESPDAVRRSRPPVAPIDFVAQIPRAPRAPVIAEHDAPTGDSSRPPPESPHVLRMPISSPSGTRPGAHSSTPPASRAGSDAARRLLARKMGRRLPGPEVQESIPPVSASSADVLKAVDADLRKRYDARVNPGKGQADKHRVRAEEAAASGDWAGAVSSIKLASQASPDDVELQSRMASIEAEADRALAPKFLEQARYEEKDGRHERAANSYERAARGKNSAELYDKAARCLLKLDRLDPDGKRKLIECARKSVSIDNRSADYRLTLARAYDATGMRTSAQGEVRRALELEPNNSDAKQLQKALKS